MYPIKNEMVIGPASRLIVLLGRLEHAMSGSNSEIHMYVSLCILCRRIMICIRGFEVYRADLAS
jgi:hypothetical protein